MYQENFRVPIPEGSRVTQTGLVQCRSVRNRWLTIGKLPETGPLCDSWRRQLMIPNGLYRQGFSHQYTKDMVEKDPDNIPPFFDRRACVGAFALILGVATRSGLYDLLIDLFGVETSNAILDAAMFYNMHQQVDLEWVYRHMQDQLMFSIRTHTCEWYEHAFDPLGYFERSKERLFDSWDDDDFEFDLDDIDDEYVRADLRSTQRQRQFPPREEDAVISHEKVQEFMRRWTALRQKAGHRDTAIYLQGTTAVKGRNPYDEPEKWSVMAVCETGGDDPGMPLAYNLYYSAQPKLADAQEALGHFRDLGLDPKRIIATVPFLGSEFFSLCEALQMPWLIKLQSDFLGHETMLQRHEEELRQGHGTPITARDPMVAVSDADVTLFPPYMQMPDRKGYVVSYCTPASAIESMEYMNEQLAKTFEEACTVLEQVRNAEGKDKLDTPSTVQLNPNNGLHRTPVQAAERRALTQLYFAVCKTGGPFYHPNSDAWECLKLEYLPEEDWYRCGIDEERLRYERCRGNYFSLASSEPMDLQAMFDDLPLSYYLNDYTFSAMHAQLNTEQPGTYDFSTMFFVAFISDIVRTLLLPSFKQFEAAKDGEVKEAELEECSDEEAKEEYTASVNIGKMIHWLNDVCFRYSDSEPYDLTYAGYTGGVRGAVLEAAGIRRDFPELFKDLVDAADVPSAIQKLRQEKRTIPKKRGRPKGSKSKPKADTAKG